MVRENGTRLSRRLVLLAVLLSCFAAPSRLHAVVVVIGSAQVPPSPTPQIGTLDVYLSSMTEDPIDLAGFQLTLTISGPDEAVTFSGASAPTAGDYVFAPELAAPIVSISGGGSQLTLGDFLDSGFGQIVDGTGLATIQFTVQPQAAGKTYNVVLDLDPSVSFLAADSETFLSFDTQNGQISAVPESSHLYVVMVVACGVLAVVKARRNRLKFSR